MLSLIENKCDIITRDPRPSSPKIYLKLEIVPILLIDPLVKLWRIVRSGKYRTGWKNYQESIWLYLCNISYEKGGMQQIHEKMQSRVAGEEKIHQLIDTMRNQNVNVNCSKVLFI